ncbi:STAS domain-containing protein [Planotetraspora phitsanulokensis]|uniref:Anti-sigma factor antagonist n=1 Tax=Planotetraspora phitsanulokensis TaxID=575192 RepID=A0A8J3UG31_9ACTN|nr:STAS domain-containing protein [Planotetraspora phitsanulokensis]GII41699.1 anti-sigma factor antagonist [Planotetraspora phitsanulokensis]
MSDFRVTVETRPPFTVVSVSGEIDIITEPAFRAQVDELLDRPVTRLVFDLTELRFLDSAGLRVILDAYTRLGRGDRVVVCGLLPNIQRLFHILGLSGRLPIYPTLDEALTSSPTPPP